jgi:6-phosphogluconolactonase (cycloisomerase 2 family)
MEPEALKLLTGIGPTLTHWRLILATPRLEELGSLILPANVQYAWPHPSRHCLYVASSNGGGRHGPRGDQHHLTACAVDPQSGELAVIGEAVSLPSRPIHLTVDSSATHLLVAFNNPSAIRVYSVNKDGSPGQEIPQPGVIDAGNYAHQVRVTEDEKYVLTTALGGNPYQGRAEDAGAINLFQYSKGILGAQQVVAPNSGYGFGPRHLDIHQNGRWVYVSLERQNRLEMFELEGDSLSTQPKFSQPLLSRGQVPGITQSGGTVHVHPNGRFVYGANRASDTVNFEGAPVFAGGENTLAVYRIDPGTGAPKLIQHVETRGFHCRTFHIDPTGETLIAAHIMGMKVRDGGQIKAVPPCLTIFRIAEDGRLHFDHLHPMETHGASMFWMGMPGWKSQG